jgi:superkiller protein 3
MTGVVVDEEGNPLQGARVYLKNVSTNNVVRPAKTSKKGRFTYTSLPPARYIFWAELEGYMMARLVVTLTGGTGNSQVQTYFYDEEQDFKDVIRTLATGGTLSQVKNEFEFTMTTPDKHTAVVNRLHALFSGLTEEEADAAAAPPAPREKTNFEKGKDFLAEGNNAAAIPHLTLAVQETEDPEELLEVHYELGRAALESGDLDTAESSLKMAKELDATKPGVCFHLARVFNEKGMKTEAVQALEQELDLSPDSEVVLQNLAALYFDTGRSEKAIEMYEALVEVNPEDYESFQALAAIYKEAGDRQKEAEIYERMGDSDPSGQSLYNLGNLAFNEDDREKAKFYYQRVIDKNPEHAMAQSFARLKPKDPRAEEARTTANALKEMLGSS